MTLVAQTRVPDEIYEQARKEFDEKALADLMLAVAAINAWNRLAIFCAEPRQVRISLRKKK